MTFKYCK